MGLLIRMNEYAPRGKRARGNEREFCHLRADRDLCVSLRAQVDNVGWNHLLVRSAEHHRLSLAVRIFRHAG